MQTKFKKRPNYRIGIDVGTRDFYNMYRHLGGKYFDRNSFKDPYDDLMNGFMNVILEEDEDLPLLYMRKSFGARSMRGIKTIVDWMTTWENWRKEYPGKTRAEILDTPDKSTVLKKRIRRIVVWWLKGHVRGCNKLYKAKYRLYYLRASYRVRRKITSCLDDGQSYLDLKTRYKWITRRAT